MTPVGYKCREYFSPLTEKCTSILVEPCVTLSAMIAAQEALRMIRAKCRSSTKRLAYPTQINRGKNFLFFIYIYVYIDRAKNFSADAQRSIICDRFNPERHNKTSISVLILQSFIHVSLFLSYIEKKFFLLSTSKKREFYQVYKYRI